jgi:TonB family protein
MASPDATLATSPDVEWLLASEVPPKYKSIPPKPQIPATVAQQMSNSNSTAISVIEFYVDEQGKVDRGLSRIADSSGYEKLDLLTLDWALNIEFFPAMNQDKPVKVRVRVPVQWTVG